MSIFTYDNKEVFYTIEGEGDHTLVILNGIMMSHKSWDAFVPAFAPYFQVLRVDFFDQGLSQKMTEPYTQSLQVEMLKALFTHLGLKDLYMVGISYGGSIALQYAAKYQQDLAKLALFNSAASTSPWLRDIGRGWNKVAQDGNGEAYYHVTIPYIYSPQFYTRQAAWMDARKEKLLPVFKDPAFLNAMTRLTNSAEAHDVRDALPSIQTPTIVVAADHDYLTPLYEQENLVKHMPNATLNVFHECGHASMYEKPELFTSTILGFFLDTTQSYDI